ncbi:PEP/pyruvate-binding domain-containing protein [Desulfolutivibrio sulfoxidireducens]|uniref:PEP/pyruvate-binding domain-containing protein n=1 Tax=Desulfolutivibrio sulfoxidireducens TaxID=2773299 RepID=UPI00159D804F|nr:PEP/pyruvate-binding domain-containing protein [Desulfolutivibrio sulfoxidireducens]QLA21171.1 pyruvate, phosphate dikinase [Desulfolutivibrio sulfoxidireducens]
MSGGFLTRLKRFLATQYGLGRDPTVQDAGLSFRAKYNFFQELLESNSELLKIIADMETKLHGRELFGMAYVRSQSSRAVFHAMRMIRAFEGLSGRPRPVLNTLVEGIREEVKLALMARRDQENTSFALPLSKVTASMVDDVGGKCANLGEVGNRVGLPVPRGFAVTTTAFRAFFEAAGLPEEIARLKLTLALDDPASLAAVSEDIQHLILRAELPPAVARAIVDAHRDMAGKAGVPPEDLKVAMRSSAIGEDGELSFAGQYLSILNVPAERLLSSYKYVAASLYTPRAISYRVLKGIADDDVAMSVACLEMVESRAAGVMYTRHPLHPEQDRVIINAVWGLGPYAVDGVVNPDTYVVAKDGSGVLETRVSEKPVMLVGAAHGTLEEKPVPEALRTAPCLDEARILQLADYGLSLERHYGCPQDVEWALDPEGRLVILQSRPLAMAPGAEMAGACGRPDMPRVTGREVLATGGEPASSGVGVGPVVRVLRDEDLEGFPQGGVLVAGHSSPKYMVVMPRCAAIVAEHGSVTGHMASLCREFGVPTLLGVPNALSLLPEGEVVTVDAWSATIYRGRVEELAGLGAPREILLKDTPVHGVLTRVMGLIAPLHLLDPKSKDFCEASCTTIHDVMRLLHEWSYTEMFRISDMASGQAGMAMRLAAVTGLDLYVIDLGGGIAPGAGKGGKVAVEEIVSRPFLALLDGLVLDREHVRTPRPVQLKGFMSVLGEQMLSSPTSGGQRFGDKSYAIISDKYLNFSSRVGYHYGVLDCYCGKTVNKNYITFSFKGGAADDVKRSRRARGIALILTRLGFTVEVVGDRVAGRFQKFEPAVIEERLVSMGRLLQFTRQTDMLMVDEKSVAAMADCFFSGACQFTGEGAGE